MPNKDIPIVSLFRDFSAPIIWHSDVSEEELQEIADKLIISMFGAPKDEQN